MFFREQAAMITSVYRHAVTWNGCQTPLRGFLEQRPPLIAPSLDLAYFDYSPLLRHYQNLFGVEHVLALPMEMIAGDFEALVARVSEFAGVSPDPLLEVPRTKQNVGSPDWAIAAMRVVNRVTRPADHDRRLALGYSPGWGLPGRTRGRQVLRRLGVSVGRRGKLEAVVRRELGGRYCEANLRLSELVGINLADYGYTMP